MFFYLNKLDLLESVKLKTALAKVTQCVCLGVVTGVCLGPSPVMKRVVRDNEELVRNQIVFLRESDEAKAKMSLHLKEIEHIAVMEVAVRQYAVEATSDGLKVLDRGLVYRTLSWEPLV